jgi:tetratricopeptide (TPR) repeat protein
MIFGWPCATSMCKTSVAKLAGGTMLLAAAFVAAPAAAQLGEARHNCTGTTDIDWDVQIVNCTRLIQSEESRKLLAFAYNRRGLAYKAKGDIDRAIADYTQAITLDPKLAPARYNRGVAYTASGDLNRAIADYTEAIAIDAKNEEAYKHRGLVYKAKGDLDRAIADYTQVIAINPKLADSYYERGLAYKTKGDLHRANADFMKSGSLYEQKGDHAAAIDAYSMAGRRK